ncbi:hypothetical protein E2C01_016164 [Portunus trituberculatus]|uniref:Uncharacterized protein n=1 Tax=Portunus trituberculatus TaxID=210409 RepID=A0A5B7DQ17_PORTR|nr:hypothetical protein [Portunus trituberculatus]
MAIERITGPSPSDDSSGAQRTPRGSWGFKGAAIGAARSSLSSALRGWWSVGGRLVHHTTISDVHGGSASVTRSATIPPRTRGGTLPPGTQRSPACTLETLQGKEPLRNSLTRKRTRTFVLIVYQDPQKPGLLTCAGHSRPRRVSL